MSDLFEKLSGVRYLPIFPLPLVLMPNEPLPLHIFEPRYRKMLKDIEPAGNIFGVSYFDPGTALGDRPESGSVGCVAEVRKVETMPDGRSNILTVGLSRYRLIDYVESEEEYLTADVEFFRDEEGDDEKIEWLANHVRALFKRVSAAAGELSGETFPDIPDVSAETLSFIVASSFNFEVETKLRFIRSTSTLDRLEQLHGMMSDSVDRMENAAKIKTLSHTNGHSKKKIDF